VEWLSQCGDMQKEEGINHSGDCEPWIMIQQIAKL
jgi:hypothetical protein